MNKYDLICRQAIKFWKDNIENIEFIIIIFKANEYCK